MPPAARCWAILRVARPANALAAHGQRLEADTILRSGGLTASALLQPGAVVSAEFDGLGTVQLRCS